MAVFRWSQFGWPAGRSSRSNAQGHHSKARRALCSGKFKVPISRFWGTLGDMTRSVDTFRATSVSRWVWPITCHITRFFDARFHEKRALGRQISNKKALGPNLFRNCLYLWLGFIVHSQECNSSRAVAQHTLRPEECWRVASFRRFRTFCYQFDLRLFAILVMGVRYRAMRKGFPCHRETSMNIRSLEGCCQLCRRAFRLRMLAH